MSRPIAAKTASPSIYLIDSNIYVFRAWQRISGAVTDGCQQPANAVTGFIEFLFDLLSRRRPSLIACVFDHRDGKNSRRAVLPAYKAHRAPTPANLSAQFPACRQFADTIGITTFSSCRVEADDVIGTLAQQAGAQDISSIIVSADKDLCQFVGKRDAIWDYARDSWADQRAIEGRFGVRAWQLADLLALTGDKADNIPGVPGIGPGTAARLLTKWGNLDILLDNLDNVPAMKFRGAAQAARQLSGYREQLLVSRRLTGLWIDPSLSADCLHLTLKPNFQTTEQLLTHYSFEPPRRRQWLDLLHSLGQ